MITKVTGALILLLLLYRKKARSAHLLGYKHPRDGSLSLPPFCECVPAGCVSFLEDVATSEQVMLVPIFLFHKKISHLLRCSSFFARMPLWVKRHAYIGYSLASAHNTFGSLPTFYEKMPATQRHLNRFLFMLFTLFMNNKRWIQVNSVKFKQIV